MALPRILHVDDDEDILQISLIALHTLGGLDVVQCSSGREALSVVQTVKPDLFLLDFMMPEMTGEDTLIAFRRIPEFSKTPVIFMTAKSQSSDLKKFHELGALDVILKPFDVMLLSRTIIDVWNKNCG
ncbi:MAG: response regulator [bacterium]